MLISKTELLEIIALGENSRVEFKRDDCRPEQLAKEIVAMVNHHGGMILLGVEDDGEIIGIRRKNLEEWIMDGVVARKVHPLILPDYQEIPIDDDKRVAVLTFAQGVSKPYVCRHNDREQIFIRVGTLSRLTTREQQLRLFETGGMLQTERLPVSGTSIGSLDMDRIGDYLMNVIQDPDIPSTNEEWTRHLLAIGLLTESLTTEPVTTTAGLLLFGNRPRRKLGNAGIRLMVFHGVEKSYQAQLDEIIDLPIVGLWKKDVDGQRILYANGIIETVMTVMKPFLSEESSSVDESMRRERKWHYPIEVVREVMLNAIAHRDWTRSIDIEMTSYRDRLEIISPGAMQNAMTVEKMITGQRSHRNPLIVGVLRDYGYVDARGMGIRQKVIPLMKRLNETEPVFEATDDYMKTILYRRV